MTFEAKIYRIFIASPNDVIKERAQVKEVVANWNSSHSESMKIVLLPIGWEKATPDLRDTGQAIINKQLVDKCDLLIGIFSNRAGTPTLEADSGTIEEIEKASSEGKRCIVYFSDKSEQESDIDDQQYQRLLQYKKELQQRGLTGSYTDIPDFKEKVSHHITDAIQEIGRVEREKKAAANEARVTEKAIGLETQLVQQPTTFIPALTTQFEAQTTIRHLLDSRFGIQDLEDIREREISEIDNTLSSPDMSTLFNQRATIENIPAIVQVIETVSTPSIFAISSIGKYGNDALIDWQEVVGDWVERLSTRKLENGFEWVSYIKTYPGLLTFYSLGISALRSGKIEFFKEAIERNIYTRNNDIEWPLTHAVDPRYVFYNDTQQLIEPGFDKKHTPTSDHVASFIKNKLYPNELEKRYLNWFDLFEFLVSLKSVQIGRPHPYFGSFIWRKNTEFFIVKAIQEATLERGRLGTGISRLFNGTQELEVVARKYDKIAKGKTSNFGRAYVPAYISQLVQIAKTEQTVMSYQKLFNRINLLA